MVRLRLLGHRGISVKKDSLGIDAFLVVMIGKAKETHLNMSFYCFILKSKRRYAYNNALQGKLVVELFLLG